jgi:hypothetical protein
MSHDWEPMKTEKASRKNIDSLQRLNRLASEHAYDIEDLDWSLSVDRSKLWAPPAMSPLTYLPSFNRLDEVQQRRYNQIFAMAICEQFIWFETNFLIDAMESVVRYFNVSDEMVTAVNYLTSEEVKHTRMFWRLLQKSEPQWYAQRRPRIFRMTPGQQLLTRVMLTWPRHILVWIWIAIFFEERTTDYCRQYVQFDKQNPGALEPNFLQIHRFHFRDEARHFQLDQHLLDSVYDRAPRWKCRLAGKMFYRVMQGYTAPRNTSLQTLQQLAREYPELNHGVLPALVRELPLLGQSREYHRMAFSRRAVKNSLALFAEYPELDCLWPLFLVETKEGNRPGGAATR